MRANIPFQVRTAGLIKSDPYHSTPGTRQGDVMLTVFLAGQGLYANSASKITVTSGMIGLVEPIDIGILVSDKHQPYTHYFCRFNGNYAKYLAKKIVLREGTRFFHSELTLQLADILRQMGNIARSVLPQQMSEPEILLAKALILLSDKEEQNLSHEFSAFALEHYLQTHISEPINLDEIANYFHISKSTLCRKAKQLTGKTVCQLAENIKIDWAKMLLTLKDSYLNISEIARRVGYADALYFSRIFKKHIGLSPNNWRKIYFQQSSVRKQHSS